jgi:hypothetical protein
VLDGGVLRWQAEGIPAHGLEDVLAAHALIAGDDVADGVVAHMAHVQLPRGIGEHGQAIELLAAGVFHRLEGMGRFPVSLGRRLDGARIVIVWHEGTTVAGGCWNDCLGRRAPGKGDEHRRMDELTVEWDLAESPGDE